MKAKEFVRILKRIKREWERFVEEDPTFYRRNIIMSVDEDGTVVEAEFEGKNTKEFVLIVMLEDRDYQIYAKIEEQYINPMDDIAAILYNNNIEVEVLEVEDF